MERTIYIPAEADVIEAVARPRGITYAITAEQAAWLKGKLATKSTVGLATGNALRFFSIDPKSVKETKEKQPRFSRKKAELALATAGLADVVTRLTDKGGVVVFQHGTQKPPKAPKAKAAKPNKK